MAISRRAIIITRYNRIHMLMDMLMSLREHDPFGGMWDLGIVVEFPTAFPSEKILESVSSELDEKNLKSWDIKLVTDEIGPANMRATGMSEWDADLYLHLDDDFIFTHDTNYTDSLWQAKCFEAGVGIVNGVSSLNSYYAGKMQDNAKYINKVMECTGALTETLGGMMCTRQVASFLLELDRDKKYSCDNTAWSLYLYTKGLEHYRYWGSHVIHRIGAGGGLNHFLRQERELPFPEWFEWIEKKDAKRKDRAKTYEWMKPSHVKELAHELHKTNRKKLM